MSSVWETTLANLKRGSVNTPLSTTGTGAKLNDIESTLSGVDCPVCHNTGYITHFDNDGCLWSRECKCMEVRRSLKHIRDSKLGDLVEQYTLAGYQTPDADTEVVKQKANDYIRDDSERKKWFFICGKPGTGKTHICVGICSALINKGMSVRYMLWRDDARKLKSVVNKQAEYDDLMQPFKDCAVLYIDDFLKGTVTDADINVAFELLNYRYNQNKRTIISTERTGAEIARYDNALGSRIIQRAGEFYTMAPLTNWRLK